VISVLPNSATAVFIDEMGTTEFTAAPDHVDRIVVKQALHSRSADAEWVDSAACFDLFAQGGKTVLHFVTRQYLACQEIR
jgi:hypothetical protein